MHNPQEIQSKALSDLIQEVINVYRPDLAEEEQNKFKEEINTLIFEHNADEKAHLESLDKFFKTNRIGYHFLLRANLAKQWRENFEKIEALCNKIAALGTTFYNLLPYVAFFPEGRRKKGKNLERTAFLYLDKRYSGSDLIDDEITKLEMTLEEKRIELNELKKEQVESGKRIANLEGMAITIQRRRIEGLTKERLKKEEELKSDRKQLEVERPKILQKNLVKAIADLFDYKQIAESKLSKQQKSTYGLMCQHFLGPFFNKNHELAQIPQVTCNH